MISFSNSANRVSIIIGQQAGRLCGFRTKRISCSFRAILRKPPTRNCWRCELKAHCCNLSSKLRLTNGSLHNENASREPPTNENLNPFSSDVCEKHIRCDRDAQSLTRVQHTVLSQPLSYNAYADALPPSEMHKHTGDQFACAWHALCQFRMREVSLWTKNAWNH